jgi:long-chain fatty acid transport protein
MQWQFKTVLGLLAICTGLLCPSQQAEALLASVKTTGMGQAGVALPQDSLTAAFNPAGMAYVCDRIDIETSPIYVDSKYAATGSPLGAAVNNGGNALQGLDHWIVNPSFGINKQIGCNWTIGFVAYNNFYRKTKYQDRFVLLGTSPLGLEFIEEVFSPVVTYKFNDCWGNVHALGFEVNVGLHRLKVTGIQNFDIATRTVAVGSVTNNHYDYAWGGNVGIGYQGVFRDWIRIGVAYRPKIYFDKLKKYQGFVANRGTLDAPAVLSGGIAIPWNCWTLAFDVREIFYKDSRALSNPLPGGINPANFGQNSLGAVNGIGFGFKNQTTYRLGLEYQASDALTLRAGWRYAPSPIGKKQEVVNLLTQDCVEHFLTVGATYAISECSEVSGFYAHGFRHHLQTNGNIPAGFGGGTIRISEKIESFGVALGYYF